jgi:ribosomal protein S18 acetylase RimI-like enzyme
MMNTRAKSATAKAGGVRVSEDATKTESMKPTIRRLDTKIAGQKLTKLIAMKGEKFVGCVDLKFRNRCVAHFLRLYVAPAHRGEELGTTLVRECETIAREAGCTAIAATINADNHRVLTWYHRLDYCVVHEWEDETLLISKPLEARPR